MKKKMLLSLLTVVYLSAQATDTLTTVKERGELVCGVGHGMVGFFVPDANNHWVGLDVDFCRAISASIFNDPQKVRFVPLSAKERLTALQSGEIDVLSHNTTETMNRDAGLGIHFASPIFYDGQGFMVRKSLGVKDAKALDGVAACTNTGTTTEMTMTDFFKANQMSFEPVIFEKRDEVFSAYLAGRCDVVTTDVSSLQAYRVTLDNPDQHIVLPDIISKEPLAPAVRHGDDRWFDLVKWVRHCQVNAEELGVNTDNLLAMQSSKNPSIKRLLGIGSNFGELIGLDSNWCANTIRHVGNYGQMYNRNLGPETKINIDRNLNRLWTDGGILYAPPIR